MADRLYFRQLLSGRDFAVGDPVAEQMVNFAYLVGDRATGEAVVVDPAYRVDDLLDVLAADGMRLAGVLVTHYHPDHVGGSFAGHELEGVREVLARASVPVHVNEAEASGVRKVTGASASDLVLHDGGDRVSVGDVEIELLHTPGHTPGSQCFLVDKLLVSGDTLFLDGCGRTDLPGSDAGQMYESLQRLATLPDDVAVFPGHRYSAASCGAMAAVRELNYVFKPATRDAWLQMFG
ncbi:MAG TPA: MBL fold metallo-hydrolase [Acidimicrobiales bacterium]|nr:MBL fold metallo-hydrolase [Acidimicrobiales bacterium]